MSDWLELCRHGDSEEQVRDALLQEFDVRWLTIAQDLRRQLREQGASLAEALAAVEKCHNVFRADAAAQAPRVVDSMAATARPTH